MPPTAPSTPPRASTTLPSVVAPEYALPMVSRYPAASDADASVTSIPASSKAVRMSATSAPAGSLPMASVTAASLSEIHWLTSVLSEVSSYALTFSISSPMATTAAASSTGMPACLKASSASPMSAPEGTVLRASSMSAL